MNTHACHGNYSQIQYYIKGLIVAIHVKFIVYTESAIKATKLKELDLINFFLCCINKTHFFLIGAHRKQ
jgi:hypothetical protein